MYKFHFYSRPFKTAFNVKWVSRATREVGEAEYAGCLDLAQQWAKLGVTLGEGRFVTVEGGVHKHPVDARVALKALKGRTKVTA